MAGRIPEETIREIIERSDMLQIVGDVVDLKKAGSNYKGLCPFHTEKTPSFHVSPHLRLYHCKGCNAGGNLLKFVRETRNLSFVEAVEFLADRAGVRIEREAETPEQMRRREQERSDRGRLLELAKVVQQFFRSRLDLPAGEAARAYVAKRQLSAESVVRYGIGASGTGWSDLYDHLRHLGWAEADMLHLGVVKQRQSGGCYDFFRNRLMLPVYNGRGDLVAFVGRDLAGDAEMKYLNSPTVLIGGGPQGGQPQIFYKKDHILFGLWQAREAIRRNQRAAILVEGNLDAVMVAQAGFGHVVCASGTAINQHTAAELKNFVDRVILLMDSDNAGVQATQRALPVLIGAGFEGVVVHLPTSGAKKIDPDEYIRTLGADAFAEQLRGGTPLLNCYLDGLLSAWDGSMQGKSRVLANASAVLAQIGAHDPTTRDLAYTYLATRLSSDRLERARAEWDPHIDRAVAKFAESKAGSGVTSAPLPDPTFGEDPPANREIELLELVVWYPTFLAELERSGALDCLQHAGLRLALRDLAAQNRQQALDLQGVQEWAQRLPAGSARNLVMERLMVPATVQAGQAAQAFAERVSRVVLEHLKGFIQDTVMQLRSLPQQSPEFATLSSQLLQAQTARTQYERQLRGRGRPSPAEGGHA